MKDNVLKNVNKINSLKVYFSCIFYVYEIGYVYTLTDKKIERKIRQKETNFISKFFTFKNILKKNARK